MLDVIRVSAAAVVALGHFTQVFFSVGWPRLMPVAEAAVAVFFVLSGFVIRHVTCRRPATLREYLGDRASRIYSVTVPALAITLVVTLTVSHLNPGFYSNWSRYSTHPVDRVIENILFTAQCWTHDVVPFCNSPFWSLSYEVGYYIIYGCAFYLKGWTRIFWVLLALIAIGPKIILLFPLWLVGCLGHDLYQRWVASGKARTIFNVVTASMLAIIFFFAILELKVAGLLQHTKAAVAVFVLLSQRLKLGMTGGAVVYYAVGIVSTIVMMRLLFAVRDLKFKSSALPVRIVRFVAEGTFPIYLLHYPLFVIIAACIPYNHANNIEKISVLATVLGLGILAGHPMNTLKKWLRTIPIIDLIPGAVR